MSQAQDIVDGLIARAAQDAAGEDVPWPLVEASAIELSDLPGSSTTLRRRLDKLNNPEIARTLEDWFRRAALSRTRDAKRAARPSEKLIAPMQTVAFGAAGTAAILAAAGTLAPAAGAFCGAIALVFAGVTSSVRWRLSKREDDAGSDADALRRLAEIAGSR